MIAEKKYYPQLDAIRGISFLVIFMYHSFKPSGGSDFFDKFLLYIYNNLPLSIDVFFILSAFLLTLLGMNEFDKTGKFSFKKYFIRRALRIWPLYFLLMFFSFVILQAAQKYTGQQITLPPAEFYLFFVSNFYFPDHVFFLRILWTLSVEEQFYFFWGISLWLFQKHLKIVILIFTLISLTFVIVQTAKGIGIYFHTLTYIIDMMAGAYAAYSIKKNNGIISGMKKITGYKAISFYISFPVLFIVFFFIDRTVTGVFTFLVSEALRFIFIMYCGLMIIHQMVIDKPVINLSNKKFLIYTGKISYGLYCLHGFVISFGILFFRNINFHLPVVLNGGLLLGITFLLASVSYFFFEKPFLQLKDRFYRS